MFLEHPPNRKINTSCAYIVRVKCLIDKVSIKRKRRVIKWKKGGREKVLKQNGASNNKRKYVLK
jgi:hypothetical protein